MRQNLYCMDDLARIVADAVVKASNEHGAPNGFMPSELAAFYARGAYITPMQVGRVAPDAITNLRGKGWDVTYSARMFRVEKAGEGYVG